MLMAIALPVDNNPLVAVRLPVTATLPVNVVFVLLTLIFPVLLIFATLIPPLVVAILLIFLLIDISVFPCYLGNSLICMPDPSDGAVVNVSTVLVML